MEWLDWVIKIGSAISAIIVVWRLFVLWGSKINTLIANFGDMKDDIKELKDHSHENYLGIKRLTVMSHDMPIGERIIAGNDYIKAGGNGEVKHYIEEQLHINDVQKK